MSKIIRSGLSKIYSDKTSGSAEILEELHEHLKREQKMLEVFPELVFEVKSQFKSFQVVQSYLIELEKNLTAGKKLDDFFSKYDRILINVFKNVFDISKPILKNHKKFLTISNSKTVLEILIQLKRIHDEMIVTVCESRPKLEGRIMAKKLAKAGIKVRLISDASASSLIKENEAVIIGADAILKNGNVINKIGSNSLAILCKHYSIPFYVVAGKKKISANNNFSQNEMPPEEIWRHNNSSIKIQNFYYEEIDSSLITKLFTA